MYEWDNFVETLCIFGWLFGLFVFISCFLLRLRFLLEIFIAVMRLAIFRCLYVYTFHSLLFMPDVCRCYLHFIAHKHNYTVILYRLYAWPICVHFLLSVSLFLFLSTPCRNPFVFYECTRYFLLLLFVCPIRASIGSKQCDKKDIQIIIWSKSLNISRQQSILSHKILFLVNYLAFIIFLFFLVCFFPHLFLISEKNEKSIPFVGIVRSAHTHDFSFISFCLEYSLAHGLKYNKRDLLQYTIQYSNSSSSIVIG